MRRFASRFAAQLTRIGLNGPAPARKATAFLLGAIDDRQTVATRHGALTLRVGNPIERWRADTMLVKEPETIVWLDSTIGPDSVLYDVGANIGVYTLYAAHIHHGRARVVAFEPEALNFARLYQNIFDNGLSATVGALPIALGRAAGIARLRLSHLEAGRALHRLAADADPGARSEWLVADSLDGVASRLEPPWSAPTHLKIDVDGPELDVLAGAQATLRNAALRHVLVELSADSAADGKALLADAGFRLAGTGEAHEGMANHIFVRDRAP